GRAVDHDERRDRRGRPGLRRGVRQDTRAREGPGRVHRQRTPVPVPEQCGEAARRRRRDPRGHRRRDEGRLQLPHGAARAARPRRSRHEPRDPRGALRRVPRPELRAGAVAQADGRGGASRPEDPPGVLRLPEVITRSRGENARMTQRDRPWLIRTYSGHSSARASNALYRSNLAKGQTGLSVAFDLPTQTGYDPDDPLAKGEVGKVGVPVPHLGEMHALFDGIPLGEMNTSMTINATAMWLLAMYVALAEQQGVDPAALQGTTQNDIVKEYLSRGTYIFGPEPSKRLTVDVIAHAVTHIPRWNPINVCPYHLQEAGATPVQELAYGLATAVTVLDAVRESGQVPAEDFPAVVGRISFFVDAGIRFVEEMCKMRAFTRLWDRICLERYGVRDEKLRRFRYGVQVNSLGLTESQPENNVQRIVLEMLGVTLSKDARARAIQLPCWNEALGLPRPWDQQWSLRIQQVLAYESDLLEYGDLFEGSTVVEAKTAELVAGAEAEIAKVLEMGGVIPAVESGYLKAALVASHAERRARIEAGEDKIVGVNCFESTEPNP